MVKIVMRLLILSLFVLVMSASYGASIAAGSKIYVEPGPFGTYIISAIQKKQVPVKIVSEKESADYIINGTSESQKAGWAKTIMTGQSGSDEEASINVTDVKTKEIIWGYNVHKKNSVRGKQSAAEACAKHLKEIIK